MISPNDLLVLLVRLKEEYIRHRVDLILESADDAVALMKRRVINDRINAEGQSFGDYAESTLKKKGNRASGKQINFSDTNRMWSGAGVSGRGVKALISSVEDGRVAVVVEPERDENRKKVLEILESKYDDIVSWSESEKDILVRIYQSKINQLIKDNGF